MLMTQIGDTDKASIDTLLIRGFAPFGIDVLVNDGRNGACVRIEATTMRHIRRDSDKSCQR